MPNLTLDHTMPVTQQEIILVLGGMFGLALAALLVLAFTKRWLGVITGVLILALTLGIGAYAGYSAYHSFDTKGIRTRNITALTASTQQAYAVKLTSAQARTLLSGTDAYQPQRNITSKFGTVSLSVRDTLNTEKPVRQSVTLLWQRTRWALLILQPDGSYSEVQRADK